MYIDLKEAHDIKEISGDICIIGAGAAGCAMAKEFHQSGYSVTLLESGIGEYNKHIQDLYKGNWLLEGLGCSESNDELTRYVRLRQFGGSSGHWSGACSTFDEVDFVKRDWIPESGWPFKREELDSYYARASKVLRIPVYNYSDPPDYNPERPPLPFLGAEDYVKTKMFHRSSVRYGTVYKEEFEKMEDVKIYLNASAKSIKLNKDGQTVDYIEVCPNIPGKVVKVSAKRYILACGGIENARVLLNSDDVHKNGIGNSQDLVGRNFMGHAHFFDKTGAFFLNVPEKYLQLYYYQEDPLKKGITGAFLSLSQEKQRELKILNAIVGIGIWSIDISTTDRRDDEKEIKTVYDEYQLLNKDLGVYTPNPENPYSRFYHVFIEQEPLSNSRVLRSKEKDWLGINTVDVEAKITELQKQTFLKTVSAIGAKFSQANVGKAQIIEDEKRMYAGIEQVLGYHHIGTTKIGETEKSGVVDLNCKVFGLDNLFIAGSSVFPTSGGVNPTYTITAMSIRLADHVKSTLKS